MNPAIQAQYAGEDRVTMGVYQPCTSEANVARWRVNGYRATICIWTAEEWEKMTDRPTDAQYYPCGIWCALRFE